MDANDLPVRLGLTAGEVHDNALFVAPARIASCCWQIEDLTPTGLGRSPFAKARGPTYRRNAIARIRSASALSSIERVTVERFFNKIKHCRRVATRYDKLAANYLAFVKLACIRLWLRVYEFTA